MAGCDWRSGGELTLTLEERSTTAPGPKYATRSDTERGRGLGNESSVGARGSTEPTDISVPL
jgi:hypothetical protein